MQKGGEPVPASNKHRFLFCLLLSIFMSGIIIYFVPFPTDDSHSVRFFCTQLLTNYWKRPQCSCLRSKLPPLSSHSSKNQQSLCSEYATRRGPNQRIISISLFGPKENGMFQLNKSISFLNELINDVNTIYPDGFILRVYHDQTLHVSDTICPLECQHSNVDFCDISLKAFIPPKIWRFLPAADPLVDIMMSRDLDSALTRRERVAVDAWIASNKSFHSMRDHPMHGAPMLGGMWGFRRSFNLTLFRMIDEKIHNQQLVQRYGGKGDQGFLANEVWPYARLDAIVHDSFLCQKDYGQKPLPFPTQRPSANETNCFVGCVRPCCGKGKMPFDECPKACRPNDHPEWIYC